MAFDWLARLQRRRTKPDHYAEKLLRDYGRGVVSGGAVVGVRIETDEACCAAARSVPPDAVYAPNTAPRLPLPECTRGRDCCCVYRPVMTYEE